MAKYGWYKGVEGCDCEYCYGEDWGSVSDLGTEAKMHGPKFRNWKETKIPNQEILEQSVVLFLQGIGEDPTRSDLVDTPRRVAKMYSETLSGYDQNPADVLTMFENTSGYSGPVILRGAELYSFCAHHFQPFIGEIDIAYQPQTKIVGLSKLVRIARIYAKRLQVQEQLTKEISDALWEYLEPEWVVVRYTAEHFCMRIRGVRVKESSTTTITGHGTWPPTIFQS